MLHSLYKGILFDTSFLMEAVQSPGSLSYLEEFFSEYPFYISKSVFKELSHIAEGEYGARSRRAQLALEYIKKSRRFKMIKSVSKKPDKDIILLAEENLFIVATDDKEIRKTLLEKGIKTIYLKDNHPHLI